MLYRIGGLLLLLTVSCFTEAQISPKPGAKLTYNQIMFEYDKVYGADEYVVQIGLNQYGELFEGSVTEQKDSSTAMMIGGLKFGKKYIWRYAGIHNGKRLDWKGPYYFGIEKDIYVDTGLYRLRVLKNDTQAKVAGLLLLDEVHSIVDRNGNFVLYLKPDEATMTPEGEINDLELTPFGTLTFLEGRRAVETDLNGVKLWQAPKDSPVNDQMKVVPSPYNYHHCFKHLKNGNYMVLSKTNEPDLRFSAEPVPSAPVNPAPAPSMVPSPAGGPVSLPVANRQMALYSTIPRYDLIKEFDKKGNLVWSWNSKDYFTSGEVKDMLTARPDSGVLTREPGGHLNAFDVDEKNGYVFAGFRNISRVVKIDQKSGKVVHSWGAKMPSGGALEGDGFFAKQHGLSILYDGSIAVFSNGSMPPPNSNSAVEPSGVVIFSQPSDGSKSSILWKFDCRFNEVVYHSIRGGSVTELKSGNLLVDMGRINRVFEVTRNKQIVWEAVMEKYENISSTWEPKSLYQVNYTSSLYPCYFTAQAGCDTLTDKEPVLALRIFNNGSEDDSYVVKVSSTHGDYKKQFTTSTLQSGRSARFEIKPELLARSNEKITVYITSKTNPDFERTVVLQFLKGAK